MKQNVNNMATWCLVKNKAEEFIAKIKSGELSYGKLRKMESSDRSELFKKTLGVSDSDAKRMNVLFEQKLLQKDFFNAMDSWQSKVSGIPTKRMETIRKQISIRKEESTNRVFSPAENKIFMAELAEHKAGIGLTRDEASKIFKISQEMRASADSYDVNSIKSRLAEAKKGELTKEETRIVDTILEKITDEEANGTLRKFLKSSAWKDLRVVMEDGIPDDVREKVTGVIEDVISNRESNKYGIARKAYERVIGELKLAAEGNPSESLKNKEYGDFITKTVKLLGGTWKSAKGSFDASAIGRQGRPLLYRGIAGTFRGEKGALVPWLKLSKANYDAWITRWRNTEYPSLKKELDDYLIKSGTKKKDLDTTYLDGIQISIYNSPLGKNGVFDTMGISIGGKEEQFPKSFISKVPGFAQSEEAFTGSLWIARADAATRFYNSAIKTYKKQGIDLLAPENKELYESELKSIGLRVNSLTGRGTTGIGKMGEVTGTILWSPKLIQATIDNMTGHFFNRKNMTPNQLSEARKDLVGNILVTGSTLFGAKEIFGQNVETDPTSSKFGTINGIDTTGGMGGYIAFISRLGVMGYNSVSPNSWEKIGVKSSKTGISEPSQSGGYGNTFVDTVSQFVSGKSSPIASLVTHVFDGYNFSGESMKIDPENPGRTAWIWAKETIVPIPIERVADGIINNKINGFSDAIKAATIADFFGFSDKNYVFTSNWDKKDTNELTAFKKKVGSKKFVDANNEYSAGMNNGIMKFKESEEYNKLSNANKKKVFDNLDNREKNKVFAKYGFNAKSDIPTSTKEKTLSNYEIDSIVSNIQKQK